jgi:hypothetical protein
METTPGGVTYVRRVDAADATTVAAVDKHGEHVGRGAWRWHIHWSAIWIGALTALAVALLFGLAGTAFGAHRFATDRRLFTWRDVGFASLAFSVFGAFLSYVAGGWVAGRLAAFRRAEPSMLHGAMAFLITLPILLVLAALGATNIFGAWYGGLGGVPAWVAPPALPPANAPIPAPDPRLAAAARNGALAALMSLLLGLMGSVIGGWAASGEPMTFTHYKTRDLDRDGVPETSTIRRVA